MITETDDYVFLKAFRSKGFMKAKKKMQVKVRFKLMLQPHNGNHFVLNILLFHPKMVLRNTQILLLYEINEIRFSK